jgi:hypothetical protein
MNFLTAVPFDLEKQMSIENNLASIAASLAVIAEALKSHTTTDVRQAAVPVAVPAPVAAAPVVAAPAPVPAPVVEAAPAAPVQAAPACPITDQPSLVAYVMASYKEMGPVKGNQIQGVLAALGIANINEATTAHYPAIHAGVEALKAQ